MWIKINQKNPKTNNKFNNNYNSIYQNNNSNKSRQLENNLIKLNKVSLIIKKNLM